jgi:hypothetical protein
MTAIRSHEVSLLDTAGALTREWFVCYFPRRPYYWFAKYLEPGFRHVELARSYRYGPDLGDVLWLRMISNFESLNAEIEYGPDPPWAGQEGVTVQKVTAVLPLGKLRSWFEIGPQTCVEMVKQALGINAFFVRTPFQLYRYIRRRNGVITR